MKHPNKPIEPTQEKAAAVNPVKVLPEMRKKANDFLNSKKINTKVLAQLVKLLNNAEYNACSVMYMLEVVFKNLLKRAAMHSSADGGGGGGEGVHVKCNELYEKAWTQLLERLSGTSKEEIDAALKVCMQLIAVEATHPISPNKGWPMHRMKSILTALLGCETIPTMALQQFEKYARCLDVLHAMLKLLPKLAPTSYAKSPETAMNYLAIVNLLDLGKKVMSTKQLHVQLENADNYDYEVLKKLLNKIWNGIFSASSNMNEKVHRQVLVLLLERMLPHLENPILLTDFLMDSLHQFDGPIALLALQGLFTLMQKHNITYPDVYEKLYNMFYPRMFYNRYKPRLFYLADIFLTSTHLPENLVAAFAKRMARLALKSPTVDALIMIRFICNLLLRHTGLQRLIHATVADSTEHIADPYDETATDPIKSHAIDSSLWELMLLQKHAVPEVANAARFISSALPAMEFDLTPLLEMKESDLFDAEIKKQAKQFALGYERPTSFGLPQNDMFTKYWNLC